MSKLKSSFDAFRGFVWLSIMRQPALWVLDKIGFPGMVVSGVVSLGAIVWGRISHWDGLTIALAALFVFTIFLGLLIGIHWLWVRSWKHRDTKENRILVRSMLKLCRDMLDTITDDDRRDPLYSNFSADRESQMQQLMTHMVDATATYERRFMGRVEDARQFMSKEGLLDGMELFGHETNPIVRKRAAAKIEAAARNYARKCGIEPDYY